MTVRRRPFKQVDLTRALRATRAAGVEVARIEIDTETGKIIVIAGTGEPPTPANAFDRWKARNAGQT